jgi:hypothetical protein
MAIKRCHGSVYRSDRVDRWLLGPCRSDGACFMCVWRRARAWRSTTARPRSTSRCATLNALSWLEGSSPFLIHLLSASLQADNPATVALFDACVDHQAKKGTKPAEEEWIDLDSERFIGIEKVINALDSLKNAATDALKSESQRLSAAQSCAAKTRRTLQRALILHDTPSLI